MMRAIACAKVNLSLRVGARRDDGLHDIDGIFQSIGWVDELALQPSTDGDGLGSRDGSGPDSMVDGWKNLAWLAVMATRESAGSNDSLSLRLDKQVPAAAGLGGGSADAAAALALGGSIFDLPMSRLLEIGAGLGSDVPFCLTGGTARVAGTGAELTTLDPVGGFSIALVVPPIELATGAVYSKWDELGGPTGPAVAGKDLPPQLRHFESLANDLYPAAVATAPALEDWRAELSSSWGRPVLLTGSGATLFGFFVDRNDATDALDSTPLGARAKAAVVPVPFGWAMRHDNGSIEASTTMTPAIGELIRTLTDWS